jgi:hypothetical protein
MAIGAVPTYLFQIRQTSSCLRGPDEKRPALLLVPIASDGIPAKLAYT